MKEWLDSYTFGFVVLLFAKRSPRSAVSGTVSYCYCRENRIVCETIYWVDHTLPSNEDGEPNSRRQDGLDVALTSPAPVPNRAVDVR